MGLDRINTTRYHSDKEQAVKLAKEQLRTIIANKKAFENIRGGGKYLSAALSMDAQLEPLSPNQLSYIDSIYEKMWSGKGYDSFTPTYKPNKKTMLNFGGSYKK